MNEFINMDSDTNLLDKGKTCEITDDDKENFAEFCMDITNKQKCIKLGKLRESCIANAFTSTNCHLNDILNNNTYIISAGSTNWNSDRDFSIFTSSDTIDILLTCIKNIFYTTPSKYRPFEKLFDNNYYIELLLYPISMKKSLIDIGFNNIYNINGNSKYLFALLPYSDKFYKNELLVLKKKQNGISPRNEENEYGNIKKQGKHSKNMFLNIKQAIKTQQANNILDYLNNACKEYLKTRSYKSESYVTQSSFMVVVLSSQLKIKLNIPLKCYIISAYENLLDFINHIKTKYNRKIRFAYVELLKFSKYFYRIFDSLNKSIGYCFPDIGKLINLVVYSSEQVIKHRGEDINKSIKEKIDICILYIHIFNEFINKICVIKKYVCTNINIQNITNMNIKVIFDNLLNVISYIANKIALYKPSTKENVNSLSPFLSLTSMLIGVNKRRDKEISTYVEQPMNKRKYVGEISTFTRRTMNKRRSKKKRSKKKRSKKKQSKKRNKTKRLR